jgi:hypothetical protein
MRMPTVLSLRGGGKKTLGPGGVLSWIKRLQIWFTLILEYPALRRVFLSHKMDGFFDYGTMPRSFQHMSEHEAHQQLMAMRRQPCDGPFASTLEFRQDGAVLPTYLPVEQGAASSLGAVSLAAADLYEARTISYPDALRNADSINDLRLQIKLHGKDTRDNDLSAGTEHLEIV